MSRNYAMDEPAPRTDDDLLRRGIAVLAKRIPTDWQLDPGGIKFQSNEFAILRAPEDKQVRLLFKPQQSLETRDVANLAGKLLELAEETASAPILVVRYVSPQAREALEARGINYIDLTGNLRVNLSSPPVLLRDIGASRDPWRGPGRPRQSFQGLSAARIVRALVDWAPPVTVPELARRADTSLGSAYRVVGFLDKEGYIQRRPRGPIETIAWRPILERWADDYNFAKDNSSASYLEPRGLPEFLDNLRSTKLKYVLTGSVAAQYLAPYVPARLGMLYVEDLDRASDYLGLRPAPTGGNIALAAAKDEFVFERSFTRDDLRLAAPSQIVVDLMAGPGRSPAEAEALLDWMETHESDWRR